MNDKMNKTSICSVVSLDIIDYSKKTDAEQIEVKNQFDSLVDLAVIDIPQNDRIIIDTGSGAAIACSGPLEDALEDALFISITIRDEILKNNVHSSMPLYVQIGINLGSVRVVKDAKGKPNITGEGIDEAQRIMSFANPNQILVSRVYYDMASKLTQEITQMFEKYDMHAHEQDVYAVRLLKEAAAEDFPTIPTDGSEVAQSIVSKINWKYAALGLLVLAAFFELAKLVITPTEPTITLVQPPVIEKQPVVEESTAKPETKVAAEPRPAAEPAQTAAPVVADEPKKAKVAQKKPQQKAAVETKTTISKTEKPAANAAEKKAPANTAVKHVESKAEKDAAKEKSGWQTIKESVTSGTEHKCSQAEIAMHQCSK